MTSSRKSATRSGAKREPGTQEINVLVALFKQGRYAEIENLARAMTVRFPQHAFGWKAMGTALLQQGRAAEAVAPLQKAVELSQGDVLLYNNLGNTFAKLDRLPEAEASYRQALRFNPGFIEAHSNLGSVLHGQGRLPEAEASYRRVLELRPDYAEAHNSLGNILQESGRLSEAEASYRHALELKSDCVEAHSNLGNILLKRGRLPEAEASYRRVLELKPDYAEAHYNLGVSLLEQSKFPEAEACLRRTIELRPSHAEAYINLGNTFLEQGHLPEAEASFRRALELKPGFVEARNNLANVIYLQGRFSEALEVARDILRSMAAQNPINSTALGTATPITALLFFGRAGSMFFHSLFDGHPELATLPGIYFKGWFGQDVWKRFAPNPTDPKWRERLAKCIVKEFQPLFDARCQENVVGKPFGNSDWLAKYSGFMDMGADRSQPFVIDQYAFAAALLSLLAPLSSVDQKSCFELIHRAFEVAIRGNTSAGSREGGQIFYHIHNPEIFELAHFLHHYPQARLLYIVRHPVQGMESWMLGKMGLWVLGGNAGETDALASQKDINTMLLQWNMAVGLVITMFKQLYAPFNTLLYSRGVKLEDVKRDARRVMPQIAAWMGISDHPALYEASFCGLQYWGPASKTTGKITGFDTKAIDRPVGRLLGPRDIIIFETLFWPFSHLYGYTDMGADVFSRQLAEIRPWLDEPLEFETRLYAELSDHTQPLEELSPYKSLHCLLHQVWTVLDRDGTYHGMVQPLELK